ncbi:hypothetical protein QQP08_017291 [Theobroma cacao]|nr:hypothetical protein QQP08_017291 [Theobroma cacao]
MAMNRNASTSLVYYGHRLRGSLYAPTVFKGAFGGSLLFSACGSMQPRGNKQEYINTDLHPPHFEVDQNISHSLEGYSLIIFQGSIMLPYVFLTAI